MKKRVLFTDITLERGKGGLGQKWLKLIDASELSRIIKKGDRVCIKIHMGEMGNIRYLRPYYASTLVEKVKEMGGIPFVYDTTVMYRGSRETREDYLKTARINGYSPETMGCDVIIDDVKDDGIEISVKDPLRLKKVRVGKHLWEADVLLNLAHFTFHLQFPFGAAIKNVGMGGVLKDTKTEMHEVKGTKPRDLGLWEATLDGAKMIFERFKGKLYNYVFMIDITPDCDCFSKTDIPVTADIGIAGSDDPLAVDKCAWDMVSSAPLYPGRTGDDKNKLEVIGRKDMPPEIFFDVCVRSKIGSLEYEIFKI